MLALLCQVFVVVTLVFRLATLARPGRPTWASYVAAIGPLALPVGFAVALVTMSGSLYMSEIAHFMPCNLCWWQRAFLYPQVILMALLIWRPSLVWLRRLSLLLALVCVPVSIYHYLLERFPNWHSSTCDPTVPCNQIWFEEFGFVTLPLMALSAALAIITLQLIRRSYEGRA